MKPTKIILHTTAFNGPADIKEIERWHLLRGFKSVGYHWYIRKDGTIQKGRAEHVFGAHCKAGKRNRDSIGVCFEGHGDNERWTPKQWDAWDKLYKAIRARHAIQSSDVHGHREFDPGKTCPGNLIDMDMVRHHIAMVYERGGGIEPVTELKAKLINPKED